jgi:predicted RNA-binding Zn-ribbon protein involved in translation (DUF1610 family)
MLSAKALYERELKQCTETFDGVDWQSEALSEASRPCPHCGSHLVYRLDQTRSESGFADAQCRQCGEKIDAITLMETALEAHFEYERYASVKDGGEDPLNICPDCGTKTYVLFNEENQCTNCFTSLDECDICHTSLTPNNVSYNSSSLCGSCSNNMSKDD